MHATRTTAAPGPGGTAAVVMGVLLAPGLTAATAARASTHRYTIADTHPSWATGHAAAVTTGTVTARIYLAGRDAAGLTALATAVSSPGSALYHHYLSAAVPGRSVQPAPGQAVHHGRQQPVRRAGLVRRGVAGRGDGAR